ncbi:MAG: GGDEF domain-containing protein [Gemmatimonadales bacterium]|nr:GGDEF domain-containing protein [Gemmatimonadales bacterium]
MAETVTFLALLLAVLAGGGAGWLLARRGKAIEVAPGVGPHLLPEPALDWLRRSHSALGVWIAELDPQEDGPRAERIVDSDRLSSGQIIAVDRRLEVARDFEQSGAERLEAGTLVFHAASGVAAALLLPDSVNARRLLLVENDLRRLLDGVRRRPQLIELAQATTQEASLESAGSVGLRLAYQLERTLDGHVVVVAFENAMDIAGEGEEPVPRVRVIGVSGRGDRRLLDTVLPVESSELARVAIGELESCVMEGDPLGSVVADRRQRPGAVLLAPIKAGDRPVGAIALWPPGGRQPVGAPRAELMESLANAGPRIATALAADRLKIQTTVDPLTGLCNRRGLDSVLNRREVRKGALIYADLDRFKLLNDALGHPAGDAALLHFAKIISEQIRAGDIGARVGGEEFAVWLPGTGLELGAKIAERIRIKLGTTPWDWRGRNWPLSASFGVAAMPETSTTVAELPAQADAALYVAKRSGRNRVERAGGQAARSGLGRLSP